MSKSLRLVAKRKVSNPLALAALACLRERPMHPYEIASTLRERHKDASIRLNYGSLYAVIQSLERHQLIAPQQTERAGARPERRVYAITPAGRLELVDWLGEMLSMPVKEYTQFEAALSLLPVLDPVAALAQLEARCRRLQGELSQERGASALSRQQGLPRLFSIEAEFRSALKEADLRWTEQLLGELREGRLEGLELWHQSHSKAPPQS